MAAAAAGMARRQLGRLAGMAVMLPAPGVVLQGVAVTQTQAQPAAGPTVRRTTHHHSSSSRPASRTEGAGTVVAEGVGVGAGARRLAGPLVCLRLVTGPAAAA